LVNGSRPVPRRSRGETSVPSATRGRVPRGRSAVGRAVGRARSPRRDGQLALRGRRRGAPSARRGHRCGCGVCVGDDRLAALDSDDGSFLLAPVERFASAAQGALDIREGPRRQSVACETGDWSHTDVYLAKTLDYRALLFAGSRWDGNALEWLEKRGSTVVVVGGEVPGSRVTVRYAGDDDPEAAAFTEVLIPELVAAMWWGRG
jgi:hypothetical protein